MRRLLSLLVLALASATACHTDITGPARGVFLLTNPREFEVSPPGQPPRSVLATISNQTYDAVTVRRCLLGGSAVDPYGVDLVFEEQVGRAWQAVDLADCLDDAWPRADAVLAPYEAALVARVVITRPGRYRFRVAYGVGVNSLPTDTATALVSVR